MTVIRGLQIGKLLVLMDMVGLGKSKRDNKGYDSRFGLNITGYSKTWSDIEIGGSGLFFTNKY